MASDHIRRTTSARIPTQEGEFRLYHYVDERSLKEHLALVMGHPEGKRGVLTRVHSECLTGDVLGSQRCDCGEQLHSAMRLIAQTGHGIIIYLRQEGRGIGLEQKLRAYNLQDEGYDTVDANLLLGHQADEREYSAARAILKDQGVLSIRLLTNNPTKIEHLRSLGIDIDERVPLQAGITEENAAYMRTKVTRMRHLLTLPDSSQQQEPGEPSHRLNVPEQLGELQAKISAHAEVFDAAPKGHPGGLRHRPFVTVSYAQSLDGSIASELGAPIQISSPESMVVTHSLRTIHDAILVGIGTVLTDDPQLTSRLAEGRQPQPVIVDARLRMPITARVLDHPKSVWIATTQHPSSASPLMKKPGIRILTLPVFGTDHVDLMALLENLRMLGVRSVMVEGGSRIISSFLSQGLADFAVVTVAPGYIGGMNVVSRASFSSRQPVLSRLLDATASPVGGDFIIWGSLGQTNSTGSTGASHPATQS